MLGRLKRAFLLAAPAALAVGFLVVHRHPAVSAAGDIHDPPRFVPKSRFKSKTDFSAILIGTGCPRFSFLRAGPSTLIQYKGNYFLVDIGNQTHARLTRLGVNPGEIETLMITHHHIDHTEEYIPLSIKSWLNGRRHQDLIGPPRTKALHDFMTTFYKEDMEYRKSFAPLMTWDGMITNVDIREWTGGESAVLHGVKITAASVPHSIFALAYRFDAEGKSIVVSGDLKYSENLVALAKDADVLVVDAGPLLMRKTKPPRGAAPLPAAHPAPSMPAHCTLPELAAMAKKAGVKKLVLTHFPPWDVDEKATLAAFKKLFGDEVIFGRDLLEIAPRGPETEHGQGLAWLGPKPAPLRTGP